METIEIDISIDDNNNIIISIGSEKNVMIDTSGDIELTEYVKELAFLIQKRPKLSFNKIEIEDPKINLIQETLDDITISFNESIIDSNESEDEEEVF